MQNFKKLLLLFSSYEHQRILLLVILITITALMDMIGVASILPFMSVIANPDIIETNIILNTIFQFSGSFGVETNQEFLFFLGVIVFILLIISLIFKSITTYVQTRFIFMCEYSIGRRLVEGYLNQPYDWFLSRHSSDLGKNILSEVSQIVGVGINPFISLVSKVILVIALLSLLFVVNAKLTFIAGFTLGGSYIVIFYFVRKYLNRTGDERFKNNHIRFSKINEVFGAVKEVKIGGLEQIYIKSFTVSSKIYAKTQALAVIVGQLPRFILEAIAFGSVLLLILFMIFQEGNFNNSLPIISLYVFAGYRLMPALQQIYSSLTQITFIAPAVEKIYNDLKNLKQFYKNEDQSTIILDKAITLNNIFYNYPDTSGATIKNIKLTIPAKSIVGFIGQTGSGKTTIIDIILGLLEPQKGTLEVDGKIITKQNTSAWQKSIGYVPQHIYLSDDTIEANIAFGVEPKFIDQDMVRKVAKIANIHEFVIKELPKQYQTTVGERGVRLSGGQRQRIGIARALYHNPKVLILDEATSALDNETEKKVMKAIYNLVNNISIILIAHRIQTVENCDVVFLMDKGQLKSKGTLEELRKIKEI